MKNKVFKSFVMVMAAAVLMGASAFAFAQDAANTVRLDLKDVDVKAALESLFRGTGKNFSIDMDVAGIIPSISIKDVPFDVALKSLTRTAGLSYRMDNGIYLIQKKQAVTETTSTPPTNTTTELATVDATTTPETIIDKIPLNNVGASEILGYLTGDTGGTNGNTGFGGTSGGFGSGGFGGNTGGFGSNMGSGFGNTGGFGGNTGGFGGNTSYGGNSSYGGNNSYGRTF